MGQFGHKKIISFMGGVLTKEGIRQCDRINALHVRIRCKVGINVEKDRHIHRLSSIEFLFLKAEALNFAKVWSDLTGRDTVRCDTDDIIRALIRSGVERQCSLTG